MVHLIQFLPLRHLPLLSEEIQVLLLIHQESLCILSIVIVIHQLALRIHIILIPFLIQIFESIEKLILVVLFLVTLLLVGVFGY